MRQLLKGKKEGTEISQCPLEENVCIYSEYNRKYLSVCKSFLFCLCCKINSLWGKLQDNVLPFFIYDRIGEKFKCWSFSLMLSWEFMSLCCPSGEVTSSWVLWLLHLANTPILTFDLMVGRNHTCMGREVDITFWYTRLEVTQRTVISLWWSYISRWLQHISKYTAQNIVMYKDIGLISRFWLTGNFIYNYVHVKIFIIY